MDSSFKEFDYLASATRMQGILDQADLSFEEVDSLPDRDRLTFTNGFYANCSAVFVDIRDSSALSEKYTRPRLAKLYRSYISEAVAVLNGFLQCREVSIVGDGVWAVFNTPRMSDIDDTFGACYQLASMVDMLNCCLASRGYEQLSVGIGASYGRALMVKAGYSGSRISDVVYMGEVVNEAAKLASYGNSNTWSDKEIMVSSVFEQNLKDENRALLAWNSGRQCYHGNVVRTDIQDWLKEACATL